MTRREVVLKLLCEERNKLYVQLNNEEMIQADLRTCELADADELREAFFEVIQADLDYPRPVCEVNDEGDETDEPYSTGERPVIARLLCDMAIHLPTELEIIAIREIIAEREPAEPVAAEKVTEVPNA